MGRTPGFTGGKRSGRVTVASRSTESTNLPVYAVIMAGGHGTRFWPRSRRHTPKQFLCLGGRRSLLQETAHRLRRLVPRRRMLVVTSVEHATEVARQLPQLPHGQILAEPVGRNTLPCLTLANEWILQRHADAQVVVTPADHVIRDVSGFQTTLCRALDTAGHDRTLVTIGIPPTRPETGFGYIEVGRPRGAGATGAHAVRRFREKPSLAEARRFVARGTFLWNAGIFVWRASTFAHAVDCFAPETGRALKGVWLPHPKGPEPAARLRQLYRKLINVSVDVAILEPASLDRSSGVSVSVVRADFDWSDVGSWVALPEILPVDRDGNTTVGQVVALEMRDSIVFSPGRLVALIGIENLIVVDSPDALLICSRDRAQDVRRLTEELERRRHRRLL